MLSEGQGSRLNLSYCLFALLAQLVGFQNLLLKSEVIVTTNEYQNSCPFLIVKRERFYRQMVEVRGRSRGCSFGNCLSWESVIEFLCLSVP